MKSSAIEKVREELADVVKSVLYLTNALSMPLTLETLLDAKIRIDERMYPVADYKGIHRYRKREKERRKEMIPTLPTSIEIQNKPVVEFQRRAWEFVTAREWQQFYSPASLALAICVKSGEVATCYQRRPKPIKKPYSRLLWAMTDILLNALRLSEYLDFKDIDQLVIEKLRSDKARFIDRESSNEMLD